MALVATVVMSGISCESILYTNVPDGEDEASADPLTRAADRGSDGASPSHSTHEQELTGGRPTFTAAGTVLPRRGLLALQAARVAPAQVRRAAAAFRGKASPLGGRVGRQGVRA